MALFAANQLCLVYASVSHSNDPYNSKHIQRIAFCAGAEHAHAAPGVQPVAAADLQRLGHDSACQPAEVSALAASASSSFVAAASSMGAAMTACMGGYSAVCPCPTIEPYSLTFDTVACLRVNMHAALNCC